MDLRIVELVEHLIAIKVKIERSEQRNSTAEVRYYAGMYTGAVTAAKILGADVTSLLDRVAELGYGED